MAKKPEHEVVVGVRQFARTPGQRRGDRRRDAEQLIKEAKQLKEGERRCKGMAAVRDAEGQPIRDENGKVMRRPCTASAIRGGSVCVAHGGRAPQVKRKAEKRLLALVEPSIIRLEALMHQEEHLPTALGAIKEVLNRAGGIPLGPVGEARVGDRDTRPIIQIGIAVGGVKAPDTPGAQPVVGILPTVDAEVVDRDE